MFQIVNEFANRHVNTAQKGDNGDECMDGVFYTTLSAIRRLKQLQDREQ